MTERAAGRKNTTQFVFAENSLDILRLFAALQIAITHYLNPHIWKRRTGGWTAAWL